jgi:hypothetical protein
MFGPNTPLQPWMPHSVPFSGQPMHSYSTPYMQTQFSPTSMPTFHPTPMLPPMPQTPSTSSFPPSPAMVRRY